MPNSVIQRYDQNILNGITPTGSAPASSYFLATFLAQNPAARILFTATSVTLTWTLAGAAEGAILVIPVSNLEGSVLTLTNGAGLSVPVPIPTMTENRIPKTVVLDFSSSGNRTSATWTLTASGNVSTVVFGGAVAIYGPKGTLLSTDFELAGGSASKKYGTMNNQNTYLTRYRQSLRTQERSVTLSRVMSATEEAKFSDWFDANFGDVYPGFLWAHPPTNDGYFGLLPNTYTVTNVSRNPQDGKIVRVQMTFVELSKGQPI